MAGIKEGTDWIITERAKSIIRLNLHTYNSNGYGVQKYFLYILYVYLQVELSTLKRYFIKDKIKSIKLGGNNYLLDSWRHAINSLYIVRAGWRH